VKKESCPHCGAKYSDDQPASGPIHIFVEDHSIDVPQRGSIEYSDMYCDIADKFPNRKLHTWMAMEPDGRTIKRMMLFYRIKDLKKYFNVGH
jgi:hypothetical protein